MINFSKIILYSIIGVSFCSFYSSQAIDLNILKSSVNHCLSSRKSSNCKRVILQLEDLQLKAASGEKYACQTRLLGLQTDLIIIMNDNKQRRTNLRMIKEVERFC